MGERNTMPPSMYEGATLAYLGDAVMELYVRELLVRSGVTNNGVLNERAREFVTAKKQAEAFRRIEEILTAEETEMYKRGRNSSHLTMPHTASMAEYRCASGFEALLGYLHLCGRSERITELLVAAYKSNE